MSDNGTGLKTMLIALIHSDGCNGPERECWQYKDTRSKHG